MSRKIYPKKVGECKQCYGDIIAKNSSFDHRVRTFCSKSCKTRFQNLHDNPAKRPEVKLLIAASTRRLKGRKRSASNREKNRLANLGAKSHFWKGGKTKLEKNIRTSAGYREWREAVFKRDDYTCVLCTARSGKGKAVYLQADHIKSFAEFPDLRLDIHNGRTLCLDCHKLTDNYPIGLRSSTYTSGKYLKFL